MNVVSTCPLRVASLRWQARRGRWALTVVAKATYRLTPATCELAEEQEDPNERDNHWDDDPRRSVYSPSDLAPFKPKPEVMLVGNAFAPRGEPVARLTARLIVGSVDKSIVIHGERSFAQDGTLRPAARFRRMPLRYERAAGGPDTANPVGVARVMDTLGAVALPNLEPPGLNVSRVDDFIEPIGFAPIAAEWPTRRGRNAGAWTPASIATEPVPEWLDQRFFMSAPSDQFLEELRPNERIVLENLHPDYERLATNLGGWEPRAFVDRPRAAVAELAMTCDTLWIDTDRSICTLTWRGHLALDDRDQEGRVVVGMELAGRPLAWSDVERQAPPRAEERREEAAPRKGSGKSMRSATLPFTAPPVWPTWLAKEEPTSPPTDLRLEGTGTLDVPVPKDVIEGAIARAEAAKGSVHPPAGDSVPAWAPPVLPTTPAVPAAPSFGAPPAAAPPGVMTPMLTLGQRTAGDAPTVGWLLRSAPAPIAPIAPIAPPPVETTPAPAAPRITIGEAAAPTIQPVTVAETPKPAAVDVRDAASRGVAAASNAAAAAAASEPAARTAARAPAARPSTPREPPREHVDLLWYDTTATARILGHAAFAEARPSRPTVTWSASGETVSREPQEVKDRRELMAIVSRGAALEEAGLRDATAAAYQDDGTFAAPLALIAGELSFGFDELETLRATTTVVAPFLGNDKKLKDAVAAGTEILGSEWRVPADIAEGATRRIEEAFAQGQRAVAPSYLENSVEKILLEGRRYQKKTLFGTARIRALFSFAPGGALVPAYLPEDLAPKLPLFRRFKAKVIVEVRPQEDQYETHADALLVLALARVLRRAGA